MISNDISARISQAFPTPPLQGPPLPSGFNVWWPYQWMVYRRAPKVAKAVNSAYWIAVCKVTGLQSEQ